MKPWYWLLLVFSFFTSSPAFATFMGGYIRVRPVFCQNFVMEITITNTLETSSQIISGWPDIDYGDGVIERLPDSSLVSFKVITSGSSLAVYRVKHSYPGPGQYTITYREFNRAAGISNMLNSVNTPGYVETTFTIDPYLGCTSTPQISNLISSKISQNADFKYDLMANVDPDDSLSYSFAIPLQDKTSSVIQYHYPTSYNEMANLYDSKIGIDPYNGLINWAGANGTDVLALDIRIKQYHKVESQFYLAGNMLMELLINIDPTDHPMPIISNLKDTAIVAGATLQMPFVVHGGDQDFLKILHYGDIFQQAAHSATVDLYDTVYYAISKQATLNWQTTADMVRNKPYKFCITAIEKNRELTTFGSACIWLAGQPTNPEAPSQLSGAVDGLNQINLIWKDNSDDEAGFILERADNFHPDFAKIATFSANTVSYNDKSTLPQMHYRYRIKAVGTTMSDYSNIAEVHTPVTTGMEKTLLTQKITIFPNPNDGAFTPEFGISNPYTSPLQIAGSFRENNL